MAAIALIRPLAWERPYAVGVALKKTGKKGRKKGRKEGRKKERKKREKDRKERKKRKGKKSMEVIQVHMHYVPCDVK